jgi:uncharacterized protein (DUF433 family)
MPQQLISCSPDIMGGTPVFYGTRVPVQTLLDYLEAGDTIDEFLEGYTEDQLIEQPAGLFAGNSPGKDALG